VLLTGWQVRLRAELDHARRRARAIAEPLDDAAWSAAPAPGEWSVAECLTHLNLTSRAFLPRLQEAVARAPKTSAPLARMDVAGALLWWALTLRIPVKTTEPFVPKGGAPRAVVLAEFDTLQDQVIAMVDAAGGRDVRAVKMPSPFDARLHYNPYAALRLVAAHQRLHLRQAEAAARVCQVGRASPRV
jgi:hypothetical protein